MLNVITLFPLVPVVLYIGIALCWSRIDPWRPQGRVPCHSSPTHRGSTVHQISTHLCSPVLWGMLPPLLTGCSCAWLLSRGPRDMGFPLCHIRNQFRRVYCFLPRYRYKIQKSGPNTNSCNMLFLLYFFLIFLNLLCNLPFTLQTRNCKGVAKCAVSFHFGMFSGCVLGNCRTDKPLERRAIRVHIHSCSKLLCSIELGQAHPF